MTEQAVRQKTKCGLSSSAPLSANSYKCVADTKREHFASISTPRKIRNRTGKFRTRCRFVPPLAAWFTDQCVPHRKASRICVRKLSAPLSSMASNVTPSMPGAPSLLFAIWETNHCALALLGQEKSAALCAALVISGKHELKLSFSRDPANLAGLARELGDRASVGTPLEPRGSALRRRNVDDVTATLERGVLQLVAARQRKASLRQYDANRFLKGPHEN